MLDELNIGNTTSIDNEDQKPSEYYLKQNFLNSFNPSTKIKYSIRSAGMVQLKVFDVLGNEVAV